MATKYILQPNGNIIPVNDDGTLENAIDPAGSPNKAPALSEVVENNASKLQGEVKTDFYEINIDDFNIVDDKNIFNENKILAAVSNDRSFNFIDSEGELKDTQNVVPSFKPFNSYKESNETVFADEFEILTGFRQETKKIKLENKSKLYLFILQSQ